MKSVFIFCIFICIFTVSLLGAEEKLVDNKSRIKAVGIPLADHYAGVVAYEKYRNSMKYADYQLLILQGPDLVGAYFNSEPDADIAFTVCPMVMDMYAARQDFKWVSLIHRDGNALAINNFMNEKVKLNPDKKKRTPDVKVARALSEFKNQNGEAATCAIPSPLATHSTILYKYLKDHGKTIGFYNNKDVDVVLEVVKPPKSLSFLKQHNTRSQPALFEQSLPWPDIAESKSCGCGHVAWYSKDVMKHPKGHVECVIIAKKEVIKNKNAALKEVIYYIHKAGQDIENARKKGGEQLDQIVAMIQNHIPSHTSSAIIESLRPDLMVINYKNLNVDQNSKDSFSKIMDLAFEAGFIKKKIDIDALADESFSTKITLE